MFRRQSFRVVLAKGLKVKTPALLIKNIQPADFLRTAAKSRFTSAGWVMSSAIVMTVPGSLAARSIEGLAISSHQNQLRALRSNACAIARPIPRLAPVISTIFPSSFPIKIDVRRLDG